MRFDATLEAKIRKTIRDNASPRHVPAKIVPVADIHYTRSGKKVELAVRNLVHGKPVENRRGARESGRARALPATCRSSRPDGPIATQARNSFRAKTCARGWARVALRSMIPRHATGTHSSDRVVRVWRAP
ncbi:MAG: hypothetical protein U0610_04455 [bacterium]